MILGFSIHAEVIQEDCHEVPQVLVEYHHHQPLERAGSVTQSKWKNRVLECSPLSDEGCLLAVFWCQLDLVVPTKPVHEAVSLFACNFVQNCVQKGDGERVLDGLGVQLAIIYADP